MDSEGRKERVVDIIKAELEGGYLRCWEESRKLLTPEQQDAYLLGLSGLIAGTAEPASAFQQAIKDARQGKPLDLMDMLRKQI